MHDFIIKLTQFNTSFPRDELRRNANVKTFVDEMTDILMAEAVHQRAEQQFAEAIKRLSDVNFVDVMVNSGIIIA
jgi:hypothetical protein